MGLHQLRTDQDAETKREGITMPIDNAVAAALCGAAVLFDENPELFFVLCGMDVNDVIGKVVREESQKNIKQANKKSKRAVAAGDEQIGTLFGIPMETTKDVRQVSVKKPSGKQEKTKVKPLPKKNKAVKKESSGIKKTVAEKISMTRKNVVVKKKSTVKKSAGVKKAVPVKKKTIVKKKVIAGSSKKPAGSTKRKM